MILPELEEAINTAPEYADLRRVYASRVAAEWFRDRSLTHTTAFSDIIDSGDAGAWYSRTPWDPEEVFDRYVQSYTEGEFEVEHTTQERNYLVTYVYVYGGVNFSDVPEDELGAEAFDAEHPELDAAVEQALLGPGSEDGAVLLVPPQVQLAVVAGDARFGLDGFGPVPVAGEMVRAARWRRCRCCRWPECSGVAMVDSTMRSTLEPLTPIGCGACWRGDRSAGCAGGSCSRAMSPDGCARMRTARRGACSHVTGHGRGQDQMVPGWAYSFIAAVDLDSCRFPAGVPPCKRCLATPECIEAGPVSAPSIPRRIGLQAHLTFKESDMTSLDRRLFNRSLLALPAAALVGTGLGALAPAAASAAPADWDAQFLAGGNEHLMHQTRAGADGTFNPSWTKVDTADNLIFRLSSTAISRDIHVISAHPAWVGHRVRKGVDGSWTASSRVPSEGGPGGYAHVAVASLGGALHVIGASNTGDTLLHTVRNEDGSWQSRWVKVRTFTGRIEHIAIARVGSTLHAAVIKGENLYHSIRAADGTWSNWGDVERPAGDLGDPYHVALAGIGAQLHVVVLSQNSEVFHSIRKGDGSWQRFGRVTSYNGTDPARVSAANVGGELHVGVIELEGEIATVKRNIRRADGSWTQVRPVTSEGLAQAPGNLAIAATPV